MDELEVISKIKREKLDKKNYFKTLIEEAYQNQMITDEEIMNLQTQLVYLLDKLVYKYAGNDSSSIRKEILQDISASNSYTISIYLKTFRNPDDALEMIKEKGIEEAYSQGRKKIDKKLKVIRLMYLKVRQNILNIDNDTYNDTIIGGIEGFLKIYDPDFKAQDMKITADYPLYNNLIGKLEGVEFVEEYLKSLYYENEFCNMLPEEALRKILYNYSIDYKNLVINIFQIVLKEVIIKELDNYKIFENRSKEEIYNLIYLAYKKLNIADKGLAKYIERGFEEIQAEIYNLGRIKDEKKKE